MPPFFFKGDGDHRDLPSSPTRRSSDLVNSHVHEADLVAPDGLHRADGCLGAGKRSGEHTSEIQSRLQLVCRLFFLKETATTEIYPLPLHDALPISSIAMFTKPTLSRPTAFTAPTAASAR